MKVVMHMCGPSGEASRQQQAGLLNRLKRDNQYVINAMLNSGMEVPDTVIDANLVYVPSRHEYDPVTGEPVQHYYGMRAMFERGEFSCGDGAAYEAAVQEEKYGVPTEVLSVRFVEGDMHGVYVTPSEVVDPVENYLNYWEKVLTGSIVPTTKTTRHRAKVRKLGATCQIVDGQVVCDVEGDDACCVDLRRGVWRCGDPHLNGKPVEIKEVFDGWAQTKDGIFVPVCVPKKARV